MGLILMFLAVAFPIDIYRFIIFVLKGVLSQDISLILPTKRQVFLIPMTMSVIIFIYGYFEARNILVENIEIKTTLLPENVQKFRIVQISDVHLGLMSHDGRLKRILTKVKEAQPDILVSTGDLLDAEVNDNSEYISQFKEINPRYGKFAVTGNHELYVGLEQSLTFTQDAGFKVLRSEIVNVDGIINIAGVDDNMLRRLTRKNDADEFEFLKKGKGIDNKLFTIFLKHQPIVDSGSDGLINMQLSGHTHNGQFFPYSILTRLFYPIGCGLKILGKDKYIYTSRGSGTWGPPIRFLIPPEVTVIELVRADGNA